MALQYPSALPQANTIGGYYNQVNQVGQMQRPAVVAPQVRRRPQPMYQPGAIQNAIAFMQGRGWGR